MRRGGTLAIPKRSRCYAQAMKPARLLQPSHFGKFRCIGSDCEDTCCSGWIVHIDKSTYGKYRNSSDPALQTLVTINENAPDDDDYARIQMNRAVCPFLSEGLCSIQQRFGEDYLSTVSYTHLDVYKRQWPYLPKSFGVTAARTNRKTATAASRTSAGRIKCPESWNQRRMAPP